MSEVVVLTGGASGPMYGTFAAGSSFLEMGSGSQYDAFRALDADGKRRAFVGAARFIDRKKWTSDADTFAKRDAIAAFVEASYEMAALIAEDDAVQSARSGGNNIKTAYSSGSGVEFWAPTSTADGTAAVLPEVIDQLIGSYLDTAASVTVSLGSSGTSACESAFGAAASYKRNEPL